MKTIKQNKENYEKLNIVKLNEEKLKGKIFMLTFPAEASGIFKKGWEESELSAVEVIFNRQNDAENGELALVQLNPESPYGVFTQVIKDGNKITLRQPINQDNPDAKRAEDWELTDAEKKTFRIIGVAKNYAFSLRSLNCTKKELAEA